jgi:transcriptional regulator with XRE-family HTH domain
MAPLAAIRKQRLLTVRELAEQAHVAPATVHLAESGRRQPSIKVIRALCRALDVQPQEVDEFRRALGFPEPDTLEAVAA